MKKVKQYSLKRDRPWGTEKASQAKKKQQQ
jgi:hypothetical protein